MSLGSDIFNAVNSIQIDINNIDNYRTQVFEKIAEVILNYLSNITFGGTLTGTETPPPPASPIPYTDTISGIKMIITIDKSTLGNQMKTLANSSSSSLSWLFIGQPIQTNFTSTQLDLVNKTTNVGVLITSAITTMVIPPNSFIFQAGNNAQENWDNIGNQIDMWVRTWTANVSITGIRGANQIIASGVLMVE